MFYLMMHSTHFILRLYGVGHMVNDHSDSERGNPGLFFPFISKDSFIMHNPTCRIAYTRLLLYEGEGSIRTTHRTIRGRNVRTCACVCVCVDREAYRERERERERERDR